MRRPTTTLLFVGIICLDFLVLLFTIWDISNNEGWLVRIIALYSILIVLTLLLLASNIRRKPVIETTVQEFEKSLKGRLHHFKCPSCRGIFAIKKSKHNNKKAFTLTCPDCGMTGVIPSNPSSVVEVIPEKKSANTNFTCGTCGEWIMVWAEGSNLASDINVFSCPYCGTKKDMHRA